MYRLGRPASIFIFRYTENVWLHLQPPGTPANKIGSDSHAVLTPGEGHDAGCVRGTEIFPTLKKKYVVNHWEFTLYYSSWLKGHLKIVSWITMKFQEKPPVLFPLLCLQKGVPTWPQSRAITAPPSWPHTWVALNFAYQTCSVIEPSKKAKVGVAVRWLKRKHTALFFLSSFLRSPSRGIEQPWKGLGSCWVPSSVISALSPWKQITSRC